MTEMLFFFFVIYVGLWALWAHYIYNPFIGLNGSEGEGIWLVMIAITFVILPPLALGGWFPALIWLGWVGAGTPDSVNRANWLRKQGRDWRGPAPITPSLEYQREMERLAAKRNARLSQSGIR